MFQIIDKKSLFLNQSTYFIIKITNLMMDTIDKKLLVYLQNDSRQTTKQLSILLNLSPTAVYERIKKLEKAEVISKYVALLNPKKIERDFIVICQVRLVHHHKNAIKEFEAEVKLLPEVLSCYHISGEYDYVLKVCLKDMEEYRDFIANKLTGLKHIGSTHSNFVIAEVKQSSVFDIK